MAIYSLENDNLSIQVDEQGAELTSIFHRRNQTEYLWNGNPNYWKRQAPILFPIVGSLKNKCYTYQGKTYSLPQHGFARDRKHSFVRKTDNELWFSLQADEETKKVYPFDFNLELGYRLEDTTVTVLWKVTNTGDTPLYFSIGGHPAFLCPLDPTRQQSEYYLGFDQKEPLHYLLVNEEGLEVKQSSAEQSILVTTQGCVPINEHMFDNDALIVEEDQCHKVSLLHPDRTPYLTVTFDAPLFGLWSPAKKNAPFVCIEPWYGRCDASDFTGELEDREYGNCLATGGTFDASYSIFIH